MADEPDGSVDIEELRRRVTQLEATAREAQLYLREELTDREERLRHSEAELGAVRDELATVRERTEEMEQTIAALTEGDASSATRSDGSNGADSKNGADSDE